MHQYYKIALIAIAAVTAIIWFGWAFPKKITYQAIEQRMPEQRNVIVAYVTAYNSEPDQTDDTPFETASGKHVHEGTLACPRDIPFGTRVEILGKEYTCEDRMNARYQKRFDIWMQTRNEAIDWGIKRLNITILE